MTVDVIVNNAGIAGDISFDDATEADFERFWRVHVMGSVNTARAAWPHFKAQGYGRVVNTTSGAALYGMAGQSPYATAKGAIIGFTRSLAVEAEGTGILVNAIGPAAFTRMQEDVVTDEAFREMARATMRAEMVAPLIMLLSHRSCTHNGEIFEAFSGRFARVIIGEEAGYFTQDPTVEDVSAHWDTVVGTGGGLLVPKSALDAAPVFMGAVHQA